MTLTVKLSLLGGFAVTVGGQAVSHFPTDKSRALLAYLAVEPNQSHSRRVLAGMFWPDASETQALTNLRNTLYRLRSTLDAAAPATGNQILTVSSQSIQFDPAHAEVDVQEFQSLMGASAAHSHASLVSCDACLARLLAAADLYGGDLLRGLSLPDAPFFEEWLLLRREFLHLQALRAFVDLTAALEARRQYAQAQETAGRLLALDPMREESHRQLMRLLALQGLDEQALVQFHGLRKILREELGVEPDERTTDLVRQISAGEFRGARGSAVTAPNSLLPLSDWTDAPLVGPFFGRREEVNQLQQWLTGDRCQLVTLLGMGGVGKSTLAAHIARAVSGQFDTVIWRSLLNAPPLQDLLASVIQVVSPDALTAMPERTDEMLAMLLACLRRQRCLLVFDNFETILHGQPAGQYSAGYEDYGQLLEYVALYEHQSSLLITSRERPHHVARLEHSSGSVRSLLLAGLDEVAAQRILVEQGLTVTAKAAATLARRYSGNPLALSLVARSIEDLFLGDVDAYLVDEMPIFGDIREVLEQQIGRLTPLERDIMVWLAIARQPLPPQALRQNLLGWHSTADLLEAMRGLQRRSLLEKAGTGFGLQNLVIEFLTDWLVEQVCREIVAGPIDCLDRFALLHTQASESIRGSQIRLILEPIAARLQAWRGVSGMVDALRAVTETLHAAGPRAPGYSAGNLLNLMLHNGVDVTGYDFSVLSIWQADLQGMRLPQVRFAGSDFSRCTFTDTSNVITSVAFSPDGRFIAAGSADNKIRLWRTLDGMLEALLVGHDSVVLAVAFSPDGRTLASGSVDATVRLWDVSSPGTARFGLERSRWHGHEHSVHAVVFSPDGQVLASGSRDGTVRLWDIARLPAESGSEAIQVLHGHTDTVAALSFSPDGRILASGSGDRTIRLWKLAGGTGTSSAATAAVLSGHDDDVRSIAFSPDGRTLVSGSFDTTVRLWDCVSAECRHVLRGHQNWVHGVAFDPSGQTVASASIDHTVRIWNLFDPAVLAGDRPPHVLRGHTDWVRSVAFSPDGGTLASGGDDKTVRLWNVESRQLLRTYQGFKNRVLAVAFSPDGQRLASGSEDGAARLWQADNGQPAGVMVQSPGSSSSGPITSVAFHPGGDMLATCGTRAPVQLWDVATRQPRITLTGHAGRALCVACSPDGRFVASSGEDHAVNLWGLQGTGKTGSRPQVLRAHEKEVQSIAFSPDSRLLLSGGADGKLCVWDTGTGQVVAAWDADSYWVTGVVFSPDGTQLASCGADGGIRIWDARSGILRMEMTGHTAWIRSVAFSPDGRHLASGSHDFSVRLWDVASGETLRVLRGFEDIVWSLAFSPDGQILASGSGDETIRLWNPTTGECIRSWRLPGPYQEMDITDATGISEAQRMALYTLGAMARAA